MKIANAAIGQARVAAARNVSGSLAVGERAGSISGAVASTIDPSENACLLGCQRSRQDRSALPRSA